MKFFSRDVFFAYRTSIFEFGVNVVDYSREVWYTKVRNKTQHGGYAVLLRWYLSSRNRAMTTPLTIHRFGLCGNSANESIGKHRFRT